MLSHAFQDPAADPVATASAQTSAVRLASAAPEVPTLVTPTSAPVIDAGDPVLAAVEKCLDKDDMACARSALEATVFAKTATTYQAQLLYDLCEIQKDDACKTEIAKLYPKLDKSPKRVRTVRDPSVVDIDKSVFSEAAKYSFEDPPRAIAILMPRVQARKASTQEVALLSTICAARKDEGCRAIIEQKYPGQNFSTVPKK